MKYSDLVHLCRWVVLLADNVIFVGGGGYANNLIPVREREGQRGIIFWRIIMVLYYSPENKPTVAHNCHLN